MDGWVWVCAPASSSVKKSFLKGAKIFVVGAKRYVKLIFHVCIVGAFQWKEVGWAGLICRTIL